MVMTVMSMSMRSCPDVEVEGARENIRPPRGAEDDDGGGGRSGCLDLLGDGPVNDG